MFPEKQHASLISFSHHLLWPAGTSSIIFLFFHSLCSTSIYFSLIYQFIAVKSSDLLFFEFSSLFFVSPVCLSDLLLSSICGFYFIICPLIHVHHPSAVSLSLLIIHPYLTVYHILPVTLSCSSQSSPYKAFTSYPSEYDKFLHRRFYICFFPPLLCLSSLVSSIFVICSSK